MALWLSIGKCRGEMAKNVLRGSSNVFSSKTRSMEKKKKKPLDYGKLMKETDRRNREWFGIPYPEAEASNKKMSAKAMTEKYLRDNPGVGCIHPVYDVIDHVFDCFDDYAYLKSRIDLFKNDENRKLEYSYGSYKLDKFVQEGRLVEPPPDELERQLREINEYSENQESPSYDLTDVMPTYHDPDDPEFTGIAKRAIDSYNHSQKQEHSKIQLVKVRLAYTSVNKDRTVVVIKAKPLNAADDEPATYDGVISADGEKLEELNPFHPAGKDYWPCPFQGP